MAELADHPRRSFADSGGPSVGEQGAAAGNCGELDTAFVLPGIFSDDNPPRQPSADAAWCSPTALLWSIMKPVLTVSGIKTADDGIGVHYRHRAGGTGKAAERITLDTPEVAAHQQTDDGDA
ncbi:hypothetical protein KCP69_09250 [Salmonella enterica subsp. enterica]|nr:hypothetical protein KCP69_09250 [Salmonella enterica subsp. enterica]